MTNLLAATKTYQAFNGIGPLGNTTSYMGGLINFSKFISSFVGFITIIAGLWFILQMIMGGFNWLSSHGDKQGVENARKRITHAIIGLFIVVVSYALIGIVGLMLGFSDILDPVTILLGLPL